MCGLDRDMFHTYFKTPGQRGFVAMMIDGVNEAKLAKDEAKKQEAAAAAAELARVQQDSRVDYFLS